MIEVAQAALIVGLVLIEAVVLYAGYGYIEERVAPSVMGKLEEV